MSGQNELSGQTSLSSDSPAPFLLVPVGKDYIWGGNKLHTDFNLEGLDQIQPLAEAWVCSTHPDGVSRVNSSIKTVRESRESSVDKADSASKADKSSNSSVLAADTANIANTAATADTAQLDLKTMLATHPEYLGTHAASIVNNANLPLGELPILVKLIDAKSDLSVQVHPNDTYAAKNEGGSLGKTEMWYVIDAEEGASLVYGLTREVTAKEFREAIEAGTLEKFLNRVPVQKGDVFFIRAGVIHAIGAGCLIAEVQESSNLTYRLYDYNRRDPKTGQKRQIHVDKGLAVADLYPCPVRQPMRTIRYKKGIATELLARCRYFQVERMLINTQSIQPCLVTHLGAELTVGDNSFHVLLCINGKGILVNGTNSEANLINSYTNSKERGSKGLLFRKGSCIFIPAAVKETCCVYNIIGQAELLNISC